VSGAEERLANDPTSELWGEHRSRYRFAARLAANGDRVLDVACGAGFGLSMLKNAGACPFGVDYSTAALADLRRILPNQRNLIRADATRLPFKDQAFDLVTSFETIEHVADAQALVRGIRRVLRPGGTLVLSTPNRAFGPPRRHAGNPFHVREFTADELRDLLSQSFEHVQLFGQRPSAAYRYVPFLMHERDLSPGAVVWKLMARLPFAAKNQLARALTGRPFYPGEDDYCFDPESTDGAHAVVALTQ
jgi:ubiquinone/menaquinone biosynthesis C-methylase UbiE